MNQTTPSSRARIETRDFSDLAGWRHDDHREALRALSRGAAVVSDHPPKSRSIDATALATTLGRAAALPEDMSAAEARSFLEAEFTPFEVIPDGGIGFFTGYYEPIVAGSRTRSDLFAVPLYAPPDDLIEFDPDRPPPGIDASQRFARQTEAGLVVYYDRSEIEAGAIADRGLEIVYVADPVDAFFIHIQGSARIALVEGGELRVTYAAKTGHPYTAIGRVLIEMGELDRGSATMADIRAWLAANPDRAAAVMTMNRSFIFFREASVPDPDLGPVAAAKVPLTAGRSLAVDRLLHTFHVPVWIESVLPDGNAVNRLMIAQDTGSAIVGPARGDIFTGSGDQAGAIAGALASPGRFVLLAPRHGPPPGEPWS